MGYSYRNGGLIKDYTPDDTDTEMYLLGRHPLSRVIEKAREKWGSRR